MSFENPVFIDFEASSLDLISSYPIEVGICRADASVANWLIKPHVLWKDWSAQSERIHGISRDVLQEQGQEISDVVSALNRELSGTVFCDAWAFDSFWLHRLFKVARVKPEFELESISSVISEEHIDQWQEVRQGVIAELQLPMHRAANDALVLHHTWHKLHRTGTASGQ